MGLGRATLDELEAPPRDPYGGVDDVVLGLDTYYSLGFIKPSPRVEWGSSRHAYGMSGAGGSFGFADPDRHVGYAYVMNHMGYHMNDDPREKALRDATYRAIAERERVQAQTRAK